MAWAPLYVTADEVADFARVEDDLDDAEYARAAETASRAIDKRCRRQFGKTTSQARFYTPRWSFKRSGWEVETDDFITVTEVAVDALGEGIWEVLDITKITKLDANAAVESRPWERLLIRGTQLTSLTYPSEAIRVTGVFGWDSVPVAIQEAALLQASRLASRRDSPMGVAGSPDSGSELRLLAKLDPDVMTSVEPYRRRILP